MEGMMLHCGAKEVSFAQVIDVDPPEATETYTPIPHADLIGNLREVGGLMLKDQTLDSESFGITNDGARLFALLRYKNGHTGEYGMSVACRNSYDKSMSAGVAVGANVFVCDNLCFNGDIAVTRRHTGNAGDALLKELMGHLLTGLKRFDSFHADYQAMKESVISDDQAYRLLGLAAGREILSSTMFNESLRQWRNPDHECFAERTGWSLYNACTHALKRADISSTFKKHAALHGLVTGELLSAN